MASDPKFTAARARLNALSTHLPSFVSEQDVADYHEILDALEESSGADLSSFRISPQKIDFPVVGAVRGSYGGGRGHVIHGSKKRCDRNYFAAQITAVREFLAEIQNSAISPSSHPRDKALSVALAPGVNVNFFGNVNGSTIQTASSNATATNSSTLNPEALFKIISILESQKENLDLQGSSLAQLDSNIEMIKSEMRAKEPRHSVIKTCLLDLKAILLNVGGGVLADAIWQQLNSYLSLHP